MTTVIFVHGTGVRKEAYNASYDRVTSELGKQAGVCVEPCYWGHLGSELHAGGASIPAYDSARGLADFDGQAATDEDYGVALWRVLYDDPLYELRVLALRGSAISELAPGQLSPGSELARLGRQFAISARLKTLLVRGGVDQVFDDARLAITTSPAYRNALDGAPPALSDYRAAIARAFIAEAAAHVAQTGVLPAIALDAYLRDELEQALIAELGGSERSIGGWVRQHIGGMVFRMGSRYVQRRRGALTDAAYPATGDILLYQARGQAIRSFIKERIAQAAPPRVVLAHSLGGIASVDLLVEDPAEVQLLVTVGSQAPFLYEINALQSLTQGQALPVHFPRWLNVYDLRDFLSYIGGKVFPGRVKDVEVDNHQPFPVSHSAYWSNPGLWAAIVKELP